MFELVTFVCISGEFSPSFTYLVTTNYLSSVLQLSYDLPQNRFSSRTCDRSLVVVVVAVCTVAAMNADSVTKPTGLVAFVVNAAPGCPKLTGSAVPSKSVLRPCRRNAGLAVTTQSWAVSSSRRSRVVMGQTPLATPPSDGIDEIGDLESVRNPLRLPDGIARMSESAKQEHIARVDENRRDPSWSYAARKEANAGNIFDARHLYACAVSADPADGRLWLSWAKSEAKLADYEHVNDVLSKAVQAVPSNAYIWHFWAKQSLRAQGPAAARSLLQQGIEQCPTSSALLCELAKLEESTGNAEAARTLYMDALRAKRTDSHVYMNLAQLEIRSRRRRSAREVFADGVKNVSKSDAAVLYTAYAQFEVKEGNIDQARFLFTRSAESQPRDKYIWQTWACFEEDQGNIARARQLFERGVIVHGGSVVGIWQAWGMLEFRAGNLDAARRLFSRGTHVDSTDAATWAAWGRLEAIAGNPVEARRLFEHASDCFDWNAQAGSLFLNWALFEADNGELEEACRILKRATSRKNDSVDNRVRIFHAWSGFEQKLGRMSNARDLLDRARRLRPSDAKTLHSLARLEIDNRRYYKARSLLRHARRISRTDSYIIATLALLEGQHFAKNGGVARARDLFSEGVRHAPNDTVLIRAWANFEIDQGNHAFGQRLRAVARKRPHCV